MTATLITVFNLLVAGALCVSVVRFWRESRLGAASVRRLAALSSAIALLVVLIIYSGEFRHQALLSLRFLGASEHFYNTCRDFLAHFDDVFTKIANAINDVLRASHVGHRPHPPIWPVALLSLGYVIRYFIYRFHTKRGNTDAALTGAAYWSHITTFAMVLAFLIVIAGANPVVLVPVSLVALGAIIVSVKLLIEDFGVSLRAAARTAWTEVARAAERIAYLATEIAGAVRDLLAYASKAYLEHVRKPLRRRIDALEARNRSARKVTKRRLIEQNIRHEERFGDSSDEREDDPPAAW